MSYDDDQDLILDIANENLLLKQALRLPLLFHSGGPWTQPMQDQWLEITGTSEFTTRVMCDTIRRALGEDT